MARGISKHTLATLDRYHSVRGTGRGDQISLKRVHTETETLCAQYTHSTIESAEYTNTIMQHDTHSLLVEYTEYCISFYWHRIWNQGQDKLRFHHPSHTAHFYTTTGAYIGYKDFLMLSLRISMTADLYAYFLVTNFLVSQCFI